MEIFFGGGRESDLLGFQPLCPQIFFLLLFCTPFSGIASCQWMFACVDTHGPTAQIKLWIAHGPRKSLLLLPAARTSPPQGQLLPALLSLWWASAALEAHTAETTRDELLCSLWCWWGSSFSLPMATARLFPLLHVLLLREHIAVYLHILLLIDISVVSDFTFCEESC